MFDGSRGVVVAVSGGPDSVALLDMLVRLASGDRGRGLGVGGEPQSLAPSPQPLLPLRLHIAHLDHTLRGRESAEDAEFVRALAEKHELQVTIGSAAVGAAAEASGRSVEELAREIRYKFLLDVANETGCDRIAAGHTMTDQAETFVMRLIRGAGSRGLASMRPVLPAHTFGKTEKAEGGRQKAETEKAEGRRQKAGSLLPPAFCLLY